MQNNALIIHGTEDDSSKNWFPWLKQQLETMEYLVWAPDLPQSNKPNIQRYNNMLLNNQSWQFNQESIIIGHSSGAVAILGLLQALPQDVIIKACYLVGSFKDDLGWDALSELFINPFDFEVIRHKSRLFYFLHSDNDPYCPLEHAHYLHKQIGGDLIVLPGQKHFSIGSFGEQYRQFPYLLHLIAEDATNTATVLWLCNALNKRDVPIWLDGGWGVDALLEVQTRPHGDLDIVIEQKNVNSLISLLKQNHYREILRGDTCSWNFMYGDDKAHLIDIHVITLDKQSNGIYGPPEKGSMYPAEALTGKGKIDGQPVNCISPEWVLKFHSGYQLRDKDQSDLEAIKKKFNL